MTRMSLTDLRRGQWAEVAQIVDDGLRLQLGRFGITPECRVRCHTRVPLGPVVVQYGGQEIAVGHRAALSVRVSRDGAGRTVGAVG
jgi:Fe2+ transport system protein FeoA